MPNEIYAIYKYILKYIFNETNIKYFHNFFFFFFFKWANNNNGDKQRTKCSFSLD